MFQVLLSGQALEGWCNSRLVLVALGARVEGGKSGVHTRAHEVYIDGTKAVVVQSKVDRIYDA